MKKLENYGVQELNTQEIKKTDGGNWFWPIVAGAVIYEIVADWENFKAGLTGGEPINKK